MKTLLIDNYDSFTYNLAHLIAEINQEEPIIVQNDALSWKGIEKLGADNIVISPGPGSADRPGDFGVSADAIRHSKVPLLGVCLGHQGIALLSGGTIGRAPLPVHGRTSLVRHSGTGLFAGIPSPLRVARYHSLLVRENLPDDLEAIAWSSDGLIMALAHRTRPQWGVQFHPESILTDYGRQLLENFRDMAGAAATARPRTISRSRGVGPLAPGPRVAHWEEIPFDPAIAGSAFRRLCTSGAAFWLDSSSHGHEARWSYFGDASGPNDALIVYRTEPKRLEIRDGHGTKVSDESIFDFLERERRGAPKNAPPCPFAGGFVGCFGYELRNECGSRIRLTAQTPDAIFMRCDRFVAIDHAAGRAYVIAIDDESERQRAKEWVAETASRLTVMPGLVPGIHGMGGASHHAVDARDKPGHDDVDVASFHLNRGRSGYIADIAQCLEWIGAGETYQVCLTNEITCSAALDPPLLYDVLRKTNPAPYGAFIRWPGFAILSASPERFLKVDLTGTIEAKPIKGTIRRDPDPDIDRRLAQELRSSPKDRAENVMIVDLLRNDVSKVCEAGSVVVPKLFDIESYATVHQLVSTVRGQLAEGRSAIDAIRAAFPGGSMTGAPKLRTMALIDRLENRPRGLYSGALGWLGDDGAADLSIVIRTIVMAADRLSIGVGGGIVAQSSPEQEFSEMLLKAQASIQAIIIAQKNEFDPRHCRLLEADEVPAR